MQKSLSKIVINGKPLIVALSYTVLCNYAIQYGTELLFISSPYIDRFSKFFAWQIGHRLEMTGNGFLHSHSLPFPCSQFPFLFPNNRFIIVA